MPALRETLTHIQLGLLAHLLHTPPLLVPLEDSDCRERCVPPGRLLGSMTEQRAQSGSRAVLCLIPSSFDLSLSLNNSLSI